MSGDASCSRMVRRDARPPGGFDERVAVASDWLFWIEIATRGTIEYIPGVPARDRRHVRNTTAVRRHGSEQLLTLDIVDARYPAPRRHGRAYRARHFFQQAVRGVPGGEAGTAARAIAQSARWGLP